MTGFFKRIGCIGPVLALIAIGTPARAENPDVLWGLVHEKCVVSVAPCILVDANEHFALLKDREGIAQYLVIPTDKITGVEDPALLRPETPNFFADAWAQRDAMQAKLPHPIPRASISLVVNAKTARSQNQLHIHIDCLSAAARDALAGAAGTVGPTWAPLGVNVAGHNFMARRIGGENLGDYNPFRAIAATLSDPATDMAFQNVVIVGADFADGPGFIALNDRAPSIPMGFGGGEDVQDHKCAIAQ